MFGSTGEALSERNHRNSTRTSPSNISFGSPLPTNVRTNVLIVRSTLPSNSVLPWILDAKRLIQVHQASINADEEVGNAVRFQEVDGVAVTLGDDQGAGLGGAGGDGEPVEAVVGDAGLPPDDALR